MTHPAKKKFCALALGLVLDGGDREADEDWNDLLAAVDGPEVEVVLAEDDRCLTGLFEHRGHGGAQGGDFRTPKGEAMSVQSQTDSWKDVEDVLKVEEHNATHWHLLPSWATPTPRSVVERMNTVVFGEY